MAKAGGGGGRVGPRGATVPTRLSAVRVGDYLKGRVSGIIGRVISRGSIGRGKVPGFMVRTTRGATDFISTEDAQILGYRG